MANFLSSEQSKNFLNSNINNEYKEQIYTDFAATLKYFNEDGSVNFAKYLADTANISLYVKCKSRMLQGCRWKMSQLNL